MFSVSSADYTNIQRPDNEFLHIIISQVEVGDIGTYYRYLHSMIYDTILLYKPVQDQMCVQLVIPNKIYNKLSNNHRALR